MSKRYRGGGIKDIKPQWLNCPTLTQTAADTTTSLEVQLPIARIASTTSATVIEIFKVCALTTGFPTIASVTETADSQTLSVSTSTGGTTDLAFNDSRVICQFSKQQRGAFTAGGTYSRMDNIVQEFNLTDQNGNGLLVASDSIFLQMSSVTTGNANAAQVKILYRFKTIGYLEFVGIVQSQQ